MNEFWKTARLAGYILVLPLVATAVVSGYQITRQQDPPVSAINVSSGRATTVSATRSHAVTLDRYGNLSGLIWAANTSNQTQTGAANLRVYLMQNGRVAASTRTGSAGEFSVNGIAPGVYSFIANGNGGVTAHAIRVIGHEARNGSVATRFETIAITQNTKQVQRIIRAGIQSSQSEPVRSKATTSVDLDNILAGNRVQLDSNGNLSGSLISSAPNQQANRILLMQNGKIIEETEPDQAGQFVFHNLQPGNYDFVSSGPGGNAAFGFQALPAKSAFRQTGFRKNVNRGVPTLLQAPLASPQDSQPFIGEPSAPVIQEAGPVAGNGGPPPSANSVVNPGGSGGSGSSGGSAGSGGGFSFVGGASQPGLGLAGFTVGLVAVADNNQGSPPPPNSPIN